MTRSGVAFRIWAVTGLLWAVWVVVQGQSAPPEDDSWGYVGFLMLLAVVPPLGLLGLGMALRWVGRGLARRRRKRRSFVPLGLTSTGPALYKGDR